LSSADADLLVLGREAKHAVGDGRFERVADQTEGDEFSPHHGVPDIFGQ